MKKQTGLISPSPSLLSLFIVSAFVFLFAIMAVAISVQSEEIRMLISFPFANQAKAQQEQIQQSPPESPKDYRTCLHASILTAKLLTNIAVFECNRENL